MTEYTITTIEGQKQVEGEIFTVDQFTCGVSFLPYEGEIMGRVTVTELSTGMQVCHLQWATVEEGKKEAKRRFFQNDPGKFMSRAKRTLADLGLEFPVNKINKNG